jgi:hypothetical protein
MFQTFWFNIRGFFRFLLRHFYHMIASTSVMSASSGCKTPVSAIKYHTKMW